MRMCCAWRSGRRAVDVEPVEDLAGERDGFVAREAISETKLNNKIKCNNQQSEETPMDVYRTAIVTTIEMEDSSLGTANRDLSADQAAD